MQGPSSSQLVLILAPTENDGRLAAQVLSAAGLSAESVPTMESLCARIERGCGAVVLSEEALTKAGIAELESVLEHQETWSDLPIILLTNADVVRATQHFSKSGNISLLERPFSRLTLVRSVEVALRARKKQYEVRELLWELKASKDDADRANFAKTEFLANMSHEIRTPIGAIIGFLELIKVSDEDPAEKTKYMEIVNRNSQQLLRLIDDILDLSKVEAGKMTIEQLDFPLGDFLADFTSNTNFRAAEKGLRFRFEMATPIPERIESDPVRLRQILSNLVGNAIKFTERGEVSLTVAWQDDRLSFAVKDSGVGLSPEQAKKLFRPFAQADTSTTRRFGGTGLGLVLSRKLATILGGDVRLQSSAPGEGSVFVAEIEPGVADDVRMIGTNDLVIEASDAKTEIGSGELKGLAILLVEDSPDNQVLISTYLKKTGARVVIRNNGAEAVESALKESFDLILMDVQMPVMDGHEATRKLRSSHYSKPIIALTAHAMLEEKLKCFASGFNEYLTKPIRRDVLIETLKRYKSHHPLRT